MAHRLIARSKLPQPSCSHFFFPTLPRSSNTIATLWLLQVHSFFYECFVHTPKPREAQGLCGTRPQIGGMPKLKPPGLLLWAPWNPKDLTTKVHSLSQS